MNSQNIIPRPVWYGLEGKGYDNIAQELYSDNPLLRKWISIYAIYKYNLKSDPHQYYDFIHATRDSQYASITFTVPIDAIENNDGLDDRNITIVDLKGMNTEEEIYTYLRNKNIDPLLFTPPWRCDYPI